MRISIILTILANGEKLLPLIVFKGKQGILIIIIVFLKKFSLNARKMLRSQRIIFKFWLFKIWLPYANKERKNEKLLIMNRATSHYYDEIKEDF